MMLFLCSEIGPWGPNPVPPSAGNMLTLPVLSILKMPKGTLTLEVWLLGLRAGRMHSWTSRQLVSLLGRREAFWDGEGREGWSWGWRGWTKRRTGPRRVVGMVEGAVTESYVPFHTKNSITGLLGSASTKFADVDLLWGDSRSCSGPEGYSGIISAPLYLAAPGQLILLTGNTHQCL